MKFMRILFPLVLLFSGCFSRSYNLATEREQVSLISTSREVDMGRKLAQRILKTYPQVKDRELQRQVEEVGQKLAAVSDRKEIVYTFYAVEGDDINAFALPGGYIFIFEGLIEAAENVDEWAGVLAHEIGHVTARHSATRFETGLGMQLIQLATLATGDSDAIAGVNIGMQAAQLSHSRGHELQADRLAVKYMKAAGYDPTAMLSFLEKLQEEDSKHIAYLSRGVTRTQYGRTHPFIPERVVAVKEEIYGVADYIDYLNIQDR